MKKQTEINQVSQHCLDTLSVQEFVKSLPKNITVYSMRYRGSYHGVRKQLQIPEYLKKMGVMRAASRAEALDIGGKFEHKIDAQKILQYIDRIAKTYRVAVEKFHITHVTLMDKAKTSSLSFRRMYKQIKFPNDKRRRKLVLGMTEGKGADYHGMLAAMSAKKIVCTLAKTEKTIVMCSEEVEKK